MHTIAVFALKGGVGKSALTVFLADFISTVYQQRVLVVDLDPQQSSTVALLGEDALLSALGKGASVGKLLLDRVEGKPQGANVSSFLTERPPVKGKGRYRFLKGLSVLASDREAWHDLDAKLTGRPCPAPASHLECLRGALGLVKDQFDVCLIDFPAACTGPVTQLGIVAADWWLLPVEPNRLAARDVDGPRRVVRKACLRAGKKMKGLGTVLSRCQNRLSGEYRRTKAVLTRLAQQRVIPKLFHRDSEIDFSVDAMNALDDTLKDSYRTIDQKYGGATKSLYKNIKHLCQEVVDRLKIPAVEAPEVDTEPEVNAEVTRRFHTV
jgi:chromosome partitioning protein